MTALHPNQVAVSKILEEVEGDFPTEWDKILAAARILGATEACLEASNTLALPGSRPPPALPTGEGWVGVNSAAMGSNSSGSKETSHQLDDIGGGGDDGGGGVDPDDLCAQEAPAANLEARSSAPPTPSPRNPSRYPQNEGTGGILSRPFRSAAGAIGLQ